MGIGNLYSLDNKGAISLKKDKLTIANGLAWAKDNKTMFYIDSYANKVWSFDYDLTSGEISTYDPCYHALNFCTLVKYNLPVENAWVGSRKRAWYYSLHLS